MSKHPVVVARREVEAVRENDPGAVEVVAPAGPAGLFSPFLSFSWSCTEISAAGGRTRVTSRQTRFAGGKLSSESFEGELEGDAYGRSVRAAQSALAESMQRLMQPFTWFLPRPAGKPPRD